MTIHPLAFPCQRERAEEILLAFVAAAAVTGAIPVPASSAAIVAQNAAMVNVVAAEMGVPVSLTTVAISLGPVGMINLIGRAVFVDAAKALGWFAGPFGVAGICLLGATTAGLQTWVLGQLVIAICEHGGMALPRQLAAEVMENAVHSYERVREKVERR